MNQEKAKELMKITQNTYNMIASDFSDTRDRIWPEMEMMAKKYVKPGDKILDIGCGNGRLTEVIPDGTEYFGVDYSSGLIDQARKNKSKFDFKVNDVLEISKLDEKDFDVIFMFASFNHIPSHELRLQVLKNIRLLLKPNGLLIMSNWNLWQIGKKKSVWSLNFKKFKFNFDCLAKWQSGDKGKNGELYYRAFTRKSLNKLFIQAGYEILDSYYSRGSEKANWRDGKNILTIGKNNG